MNTPSPAAPPAAPSRKTPHAASAGLPAPELQAAFDRHLQTLAANAQDPKRRAHHRKDEPAAPNADGLQALLTAHRLQPALPEAPAPVSPVSLTAHDVVASVSAAWLESPPADALHAGADTRWTFALGDTRSPLATLRLDGDAQRGWAVQLTATPGVSAQQLAAHTERLRLRLVARGQAVRSVEVDEDAPPPEEWPR
jgi:hypothetical protein